MSAGDRPTTVADRVVVVTDDGACLAADEAARRGIEVVALPIEGAVDTTGNGATVPERTSRPNPAVFVERYRSLLDAGATGIVSVHLSSLLSGTCDSARSAAREVAPDRIRVVDSRTAAMGLGFAALAAASASACGAPLDQVRDTAADSADACSVYFTVASLDRLRRGGRIGPAAAVLGGVLAVKPVLVVRGGEIVLDAKVRTMRRAIAHLEEAAVAAASFRPVDVDATVTGVRIAVHHLAAAEPAAGLAERLGQRIPDAGEIRVVELGPVIAAHTGPGTLGVVVSPLLEHR